MATGFFTHNLCECPSAVDITPECPNRIERIDTLMCASALSKRVVYKEAEAASLEDVLLTHSAEYVNKLKNYAAENKPISEETTITEELLNAAFKSAGAAIAATKDVVSGNLKNAFVCVRPPGHHAGRSFGGGYCLLNSVAVAANYALKRLHLKRVAIVDIDAHRANGTEDIVKGDNSLMLFDSFQASAFPFGSKETPAENIINAPLPDGAEGKDFFAILETDWIPKIEAFKPDLILVSFGFDTHFADTQTLLKFSEFDYSFITRALMRVAAEVASSRLVSIMEGGYDKAALARSVIAHVGTLAE